MERKTSDCRIGWQISTYGPSALMHCRLSGFQARPDDSMVVKGVLAMGIYQSDKRSRLKRVANAYPSDLTADPEPDAFRSHLEFLKLRNSVYRNGKPIPERERLFEANLRRRQLVFQARERHEHFEAAEGSRLQAIPDEGPNAELGRAFQRPRRQVSWMEGFATIHTTVPS
jgi:hypothetical protein